MARTLGRVLPFPVRPEMSVGDSLLKKQPGSPRPPAQLELFPEPPAFDPHSFDHFVVRLTGVLIRVTRLGESLSQRQTMELWGVVALAETLLPKIEATVAREKERAAQEYLTRIA